MFSHERSFRDLEIESELLGRRKLEEELGPEKPRNYSGYIELAREASNRIQRDDSAPSFAKERALIAKATLDSIANDDEKMEALARYMDQVMLTSVRDQSIEATRLRFALDNPNGEKLTLEKVGKMLSPVVSKQSAKDIIDVTIRRFSSDHSFFAKLEEIKRTN